MFTLTLDRAAARTIDSQSMEAISHHARTGHQLTGTYTALSPADSGNATIWSILRTCC